MPYNPNNAAQMTRGIRHRADYVPTKKPSFRSKKIINLNDALRMVAVCKFTFLLVLTVQVSRRQINVYKPFSSNTRLNSISKDMSTAVVPINIAHLYVILVRSYSAAIDDYGLLKVSVLLIAFLHYYSDNTYQIC